MFQNAMIDFTIGMIALFLIASLMVTALQELAAQALALRAKELRASVGHMLDGSRAGGPATTAFFAHPMIAALNPGLQNQGPSYIPKEIFAAVVTHVQTAEATATSVLDAALSLPDGPDSTLLQRTLKGLASQSQKTGQDFHKTIANWFDAVMERASGVYKRKVQKFAVFFGLVVAVVGNLDAFAVGHYLATNSNARSALAEATTGVVKNMTAKDLTDPVLRQEKTATLTKAALDQRVPIGWTAETPKFPDVHYVFAVFGWLITALATTLGAAFWFDLLKRFVNLRASGPNPDKAVAS